MKRAHRIIKQSFLLLVSFVPLLLLSILLINSWNGNVGSTLASKIPGLRNFVVQTWPTFLYAESRTSEARLSLGRMDIDFLLSLQGPDGKYLELCPYTVEAYLDLDQNNITIGYRTLWDTAGNRNLLLLNEFSPDWNSVLVPLLSAYRERAYDCAVNDPFFDQTCRKSAQVRLSRIYEGIHEKSDTGKSTSIDVESAVLDFSAIQGPAAHSIYARYLPLVLRTATRTSGNSPVVDTVLPVVSRPAAALRDDSEFLTNIFGDPEQFSWRLTCADRSWVKTEQPGSRAGYVAPDFESLWKMFSARYASEHLLFRYHDPLDPSRLFCTGFADDGYTAVFASVRGISEIVCVERISSSEEFAPISIVPATLYLASSLEKTISTNISETDSVQKYWRNYLDDYRVALSELKSGRRGRRFDLARAGMEARSGRIALETGLGPWPDVSLYTNVFDTTGSVPERFSDKVGVLSALITGETATFNSEFRDESGTRFRDNSSQEIGGNLAAFFWTMRRELSLSISEIEGLREDLISTGAAVNKSLLQELSAPERNRMLVSFLERRLDTTVERFVGHDENYPGESWLWYGSGALSWLGKNSRHDATVRLEKIGFFRGDSLVVVCADPVSKSGFFTPYNALVLDYSGVTFYPDFLRWVTSLVKPVHIGWGDLTFSDGLIVQGDRILASEPSITACLRIIRDSWNTPDANLARACELLQSDLDKELIDLLSRPEFP